MQWHLKATPTSEALTSWNWSAVSEDQNHVYQGWGLASGAAAMAEARAAATDHERRVLFIDSQVIEEDFTPVIEVEPEPEPEG